METLLGKLFWNVEHYVKESKTNASEPFKNLHSRISSLGKQSNTGWSGMIIMKDNQVLRAKLRVIGEKLDSAGVCWALFAGAAASCYGSKRDVTDLDVLVKEEDFGKTREALKGIVGLDVAGCLKLNVADGAYSFFMDEEMVERIKLKQLLSVNVPVVPVEDNILFKAILQRGEAENKFDVEDIRDMVNHEKIDAAYLKRRMEKYGAEERVTLLLNNLGVF